MYKRQVPDYYSPSTSSDTGPGSVANFHPNHHQPFGSRSTACSTPDPDQVPPSAWYYIGLPSKPTGITRDRHQGHGTRFQIMNQGQERETSTSPSFYTARVGNQKPVAKQRRHFNGPQEQAEKPGPDMENTTVTPDSQVRHLPPLHYDPSPSAGLTPGTIITMAGTAADHRPFPKGLEVAPRSTSADGTGEGSLLDIDQPSRVQGRKNPTPAQTHQSVIPLSLIHI